MKTNIITLAALCWASSALAGNWDAPAVPSVKDGVEPVAEGHYYVTLGTTGQFLRGGNKWNTEATVGANGYEVIIKDTVDQNSNAGMAFCFPEIPVSGKDGDFMFTESATSIYCNAYNGTKSISAKRSYITYTLTANGDGTYRITNPMAEGLFFGWDGSTMGSLTNNTKDKEAGPQLTYLEAGTEGAILDWAFIPTQAYAVYAAKLALYDKLNEAEETGVGELDDMVAIYTNGSATIEELEQACEVLAERIKNNASPEHPVDVTAQYVQNADCSSVSGWDGVVSGTSNADGGFYTNTKKTYSGEGVSISMFFENWVKSTFDSPDQLGNCAVSQRLTLPAGKYRLEADVVAAQQGDAGIGVTGVYLFADGGAGEQRAACATADGYPEHFSLDFVVMGEEAAIGLRTEGTTANWVAVDNFRLSSLGKVSNPAQVAIEGLCASLQGSIDSYEEAPFCAATLEEAKAMAAALTTLIQSGDQEAMAAKVDEARALTEQIKAEVEGYEALAALYVRLQDEIEADWSQIGQLNEKLVAFSEELESALQDHSYTLEQLDEAAARHEELVRQGLLYELLNSDDAAGADITMLITNPTFDTDATGWQGTAPTTKQGVAEFYNKTFDMWQELSGLPAGIYEVRMQGFQRWSTTDDTYYSWTNGGERDNMQSYIYGNSSQTKIKSIMEGAKSEAVSSDDKETEAGFVPYTMSGFAKAIESDTECYDNSLMCVVGEDGVLRIGVRCSTNPTSSAWTIFDDVRLTYVGGDIEAYKTLLAQSAQELEDDYRQRIAAEEQCEWPAETGARVAQLVAAVAGVETTDGVASLMDDIAAAKEQLGVVASYIADFKTAYAYYEQATVDIEVVSSKTFNLGYYSNRFNTGWDTEAELAADIVKINTDWVDYVCADRDKATDGNPLEVTAVIRNPYFYWMNEASGLYWDITNKYHDPQDGVIDFYNKDAWDIHQDVAYLPQGTYELRASGCYRPYGDMADVVADRVAGNDDVDVYLYAQSGDRLSETPVMNILDGGDLTQALEDVSPLKTAEWNGQTIYAPYHEGTMRAYFDAGYWNGNSVRFEVMEGDVVTLGVQKKGASCGSGNMCIMGDFQLFCLSSEVDAIGAATASAVTGQAYYTIGGVRLDRPAKGVNIVVTTLSDGTTVKHKILVK